MQRFAKACEPRNGPRHLAGSATRGLRELVRKLVERGVRVRQVELQARVLQEDLPWREWMLPLLLAICTSSGSAVQRREGAAATAGGGAPRIPHRKLASQDGDDVYLLGVAKDARYCLRGLCAWTAPRTGPPPAWLADPHLLESAPLPVHDLRRRPR
jgi:hypothetical protein